MAKYILEIEDVPSMLEEGHAFYKCLNAPWWHISDMIINRLEQYEDKEPKTCERREKETQTAIQIDKYSNKWRLTQINRDQVWAALMADQDVYAMRLGDATISALQDIRVCNVHKIMSEENVVYFTVWEATEERAADERPED